jgi:hypothetical protein
MPLLAPVMATTWLFVSDIAFSFNVSDLKETIRSANTALNAWPFAKSARSFKRRSRKQQLTKLAESCKKRSTRPRRLTSTRPS